MEILPGIGVGELRFGMTKSQAFERLGFPDKSYLTESACREVQYFALRLVLKFEAGNDDRLGWIEVHNRETTVFGVTPWGMSKSQVVELFTRSIGGPSEAEDYKAFESLLYPNGWVELQFQFGTLSCINIGVRYDDNDSPLWPSQA